MLRLLYRGLKGKKSLKHTIIPMMDEVEVVLARASCNRFFRKLIMLIGHSLSAPGEDDNVGRSIIGSIPIGSVAWRCRE